MLEKRKVYLDNAATTALDEEVAAVMLHAMKNYYGNPSSIHGPGREVRSQIEIARKKVASLLRCAPSEIFFTSGGTEADNMAIQGAVRDLGLRHVISSPLEHHAVLHTLESLAQQDLIELEMVRNDKSGRIDLEHLEQLLDRPDRSFVSLMHANNEVGTILDIERVAEICAAHKAVFHSDTVQMMGHYAHDLKKLNIDFITCAAHKFHGPKGVGFIYIRNSQKIRPFIHGGAQERNMRGGTENVYGIIGLARALELAYTNMDQHQAYIQDLKSYMCSKILDLIPGAEVNGAVETAESLYTVLNISLPDSELGDMLLFNLDIAGIAVSGGSACSSGSNVGSHVLTALGVSPDRPSVRFSFSYLNTKEEIDYVLEKLKQLCTPKVWLSE